MTAEEEYNSPENQRKLRAAMAGTVEAENAKSTGRVEKAKPVTTGDAAVGGYRGLKAAAEALRKAARSK